MDPSWDLCLFGSSIEKKSQVAIGLVRGLLKRSSVEKEGKFILSIWVRDQQNRHSNEIQLDKSFNFQGSWFEIETGEAVSILYLERGEAVKNGEDKRYHCRKLQLGRKLVSSTKIAPIGCFCDLVSSFWHFTKLENKDILFRVPI